MAQVSSDPVDIKRAFQRHRLSFGIPGLQRRPKLVSLFYAAECGLKYLIMMSQSLSSTDGLRSVLTGMLGLPKKDIDLHNIEQLCVAASILPVDIGQAPQSFTLGAIAFAPYKIHEAARYGVKISDPYLSSIEKWLEDIVAAVDGQISARGI